MVEEEARPVTLEANQKAPVDESNQRLPEVDQQSETHASEGKPDPSKEVVQEEAGEEVEVEKKNTDEGSEKLMMEKMC
jgi:hypothetical protein